VVDFPTPPLIHRRGGFSYPALAGGDGDDVLDLGQRLEALLHLMGNDFGIHLDRHRAHSRQRFDAPLQLSCQCFLIASGGKTQLHLHVHPVTGQANVLDGFGGKQIFLQIGIDIASNGGFYVGPGNSSHGKASSFFSETSRAVVQRCAIRPPLYSKRWRLVFRPYP